MWSKYVEKIWGFRDVGREEVGDGLGFGYGKCGR